MNDNRELRRARRQEMTRKMDGKGHVWAGAFILLVGVSALVKTYGAAPNWVFSWQMLMIALGVFIGLRSKFRGGAWLIMILLGSFFLIEDYFIIDRSVRRMFWPLALIVFGAYLIFRPKSKNLFCGNPPGRIPPIDSPENSNPTVTTTDTTETPAFSPVSSVPAITGEEALEIVAVFGAVKKNIYSKNFRGGEIVSVFGGAEVNLTQANFQTPQIEIESIQIFGGAKLIIPADWTIHNEAVAIFGGIEDKRPQPVAIPVPEKIVVLKGFVMFGGIEIKSY
jgi:predicted membrane protein